MGLHLGKRPATSDSRDLRYTDVRPSTLNVPRAAGGYGMDFGATGWQMLGNGPDDTVTPGFAGCGDCVWAGAAHETMEANRNARRPVPPFSGHTIVSQYSAYSGYDPNSGANDNGSDVRAVLAWRQATGLADDTSAVHHIGPYVALDPGNLEHLWEALWLFEAVGIGLRFPQSAMDQFNAGQEWSVVPGSPDEGGHYVPLVGHPTVSVWTCVTWGRRQTMTPDFLHATCDEAWAWIDPDRYSLVTGETQQGFRDADLEKYLSLIAA